MTITLAEEFLLLALKDDTGRPMVDGTKLGAALAGAAIVELTLGGSLRLTEEGETGHRAGRLVETGGRPADPRLAELVQVAHDRKPKDAIGKIAGFSGWRNRARNLKEALLEDLAEAGALREEKGKVLGLFPTTAWKPGDPGVEAEVMARVRAAAVGNAVPEDRTAALISILHAVDMLPKLFRDADKKALKRRGKEISEGDWGGEAVRKAVQQVQAVTIAVIVSSATSASAASS